MIKKYQKILFGVGLVFLFVIGLVNPARAGFGIVSPYLENDHLFRGAYYEKEIILVRGEPTEDWKAEITIDVPGANDWISINKGKEFILPKGEKQVPIIVSVKVPKNAEFDRYKGVIRIRTLPLKLKPGVSIALGGRIDVDLEVVKEGIFDFKVKHVRLFDIEEGWKIKMAMTIENTGNIEASPTKVYLDLYDSSEKNRLASVENDNRIEKVKPFAFKEVIAEFPNNLKAGAYWANFKIFKRDELAKEGKLSLSILPPGTLPAPKSTSALAEILKGKKWILPVIIILAIIILITIGYLYLIKKKRK